MATSESETKKADFPKKKIVIRSHHEGRPGIFSLCLFSFFHGVSLRVFERLCNFLIAQLFIFLGEKFHHVFAFLGVYLTLHPLKLLITI